MKQTPRFENKTSLRSYVVVLAYSRIGSLNNSKNTLIGNSPITYHIANECCYWLINSCAWICLNDGMTSR